MMLRQMAHIVDEKPGGPLGLLILASMFREDTPWLFELGMEAYRAEKAGLPEEAQRDRRNFKHAVEFMKRGPFPIEEMGMDPHALHILMRELELPMAPELRTKDEPRPKSKRKKEEK